MPNGVLEARGWEWLTLIGGVGSGVLVWLLQKHRTAQKTSSQSANTNCDPWHALPSPPVKSWLWGMTGDISNAGDDVMTLMEGWAKACGDNPPCFAGKVAGSPWITLYDVDEIRRVLRRRPDGLSQGLPLPSTNLVFANFEDWRFQRRKVAPAVSQKRVQHMVPNMIRVAGLVVQNLQGSAKQYIDFRTVVDNASRMIILESALDTKLDLLNCEEDRRNELAVRARDFVERTNDLLQHPWQLQLSYFFTYTVSKFVLRPTFREFCLSYERLSASCIEVANARTQLLESGKPLSERQQNDVLSALLELEDEGKIASNISAFFIAGSETISSCVSWLFFHLARNPEVYQRAREEALSRTATPGDGVAGRFPLIEGCVLESLRLNPPVDSMLNSFDVVEAFELFGKFEIPEGAVIMPMVKRAVRRSMETSGLFTDLDAFEPERWLATSEGGDRVVDNHKKQKYTLAFGAAPRECPGKTLAITESVIFACEILSAFSAVRFDPEVSGENGEKVREVMQLSQRPINLRLRFDA